MEYNSDTTQSEGIQPCDRCERLDWLDENMLCSFCVAWDEDVNEVEARFDEARAHVEALAYNNPGLLSRKARIEAARKWLEAQDGDSD